MESLACCRGFALASAVIAALATAFSLSLPPLELGQEHSAELEAQVVRAVALNRSAAELAALLEAVEPRQRKRLANLQAEERTVLFVAATHRHAALVQELLSAGADPATGRLDEGTTPLHLAAGWLHDEEVLERLLRARDSERVMDSIRAKPFKGGLRDHTPVFWAQHYGHYDAVERLIEFADERGWQYLGTDDFDPKPVHHSHRY